MSCHVARVRPGESEPLRAFESAGPYLDLASTGRKGDFWWFALSQGVPGERIEELWQRLCALLRRPTERPH